MSEGAHTHTSDVIVTKQITVIENPMRQVRAAGTQPAMARNNGVTESGRCNCCGKKLTAKIGFQKDYYIQAYTLWTCGYWLLTHCRLHTTVHVHYGWQCRRQAHERTLATAGQNAQIRVLCQLVVMTAGQKVDTDKQDVTSLRATRHER